MTLFADDFCTDPYWWEATPGAEPDDTPIPAAADVVIIGSGYTGLHAALQSARAGRHTVVLDAHAPGWGCSTRNGGQVSSGIKPGYAELASRYGAERALRILKEGHDALAWLGSFVADEEIDCNFAAVGRFHAAHNPAQFARLRAELAHQPKGLSTGAYLVGRDQQRTEIGSDAYHGGVVFPRHAALHPTRYHGGLLQRARRAGCTVVGDCAATGVVSERAHHHVRTPRGSIRARDVVVATNGYTGRLTPWLRRRVIPIGSYIIATEALAPTLVQQLIPRDRVISDTRKIIYYYRTSPDRRRLLFGGRVSHDEADPRRSAPRLHADMVKLFPALAGTRITHSWLGTVAYTFDTLPHVGQHDGLYYAMGYCGTGVALASYLGMRIGQQVLGLAEGRTAFDGLAFQTRPLYYGRPWFLAPSIAYYRWRDRQNR